jgi:RimJ/RimL family protein N-acetyltransferase
MFSFVQRAAAKLNRHLGMGLRHTQVYRLSKPDGWSPAAVGGSLKWELLSPAQVSRIEGLGWFDLDECLQRFQRGDRCYTVSIDGRIAHYSWVQRSGSHPITEAGVRIPVEDRAFWIYHCQTAKWARGRGIYPATLEKIVHDCFAEGYCTAWIYTAKQNVASQKGIARAGFGLVTTLHALRMGTQFFPFGDNNQALPAPHSDPVHGERRWDPAPTFLSPSLADRRRGPQLDREAAHPVARGDQQIPAGDPGRRRHGSDRTQRPTPVGPIA